jgi:hypothetical protein
MASRGCESAARSPQSLYPGPIVNRATGTYRVRGSQITLTLTEQGRTARLGRWQVSGEVQLPALVLRYPGPADGIVEERHVRVTR